LIHELFAEVKIIAMKKLAILLVICFLSIQFASAQNEEKKIHFGLIPVQFFSRSCGAYINVNSRGKFFLEYRPTYTIPFYIPSVFTPNYEWLYYQGINNNVLFSIKIGHGWKFGFLLGYKTWWYKYQWVPSQEVGLGSEIRFSQKQSGIMNGPVEGFEFQKDIGKKRAVIFYMNFSATEFTGKRTRYADVSDPVPAYGHFNHTTYEHISENLFNVALGLKFDLTELINHFKVKQTI
jgi:hypothetical protein